MTGPTAARLQEGSAIARLWPLGLGMLVAVALWTSSLTALARVSFSAHMILHLGIMVVAAPLLALGLARLRPNRLAPRGHVGLALAISAGELVVVWGWHTPVLHEAAALVPWIFGFQQASFLVAGLLVWLPGFWGQDRVSALAGMCAVGMSFMHMSMLGVLLTTAPALIYPPEICGGGFGLDPLADQRLGGVLMAIGAGSPYFAGAVFFAYRFLSAVDRGGA